MKKAGNTRGIKASMQARHAAYAVLEVLSGLKGPSEAAGALSVSLQRYYMLETRAMQGLMDALEPREKGRKKDSDESMLRKAESERDRFKVELERMRTLVRAAQRTVGLSNDAKEKPGKRRKVDRTRRVLARLKLGDGIPGAETAPPGIGAGSAESGSP